VAAVDAAIVGGGHNGLVAATLLARAGGSVAVLERADHVGGAAVSARVFPEYDARLSRYSYLVSLFPAALRSELGLTIELRGRPGRRSASPALVAWQRRMARLARRLAPTLLEPLRTRAELRALVDDEPTWEDVFERPLSVALERELPDDEERGIVLTDGLIGTFAPAADPRLDQNRCFLYHVIGDGTGEWRVPVGGMGALTDQLAAAARAAGVEIRLGREVVAVESDGVRAELRCAGGEVVRARHVLWNAAAPGAAVAAGSQLKLNLLLRRLPLLRDLDLAPADAFRGTFHVNEGYAQLQRAYERAAGGRVPSPVPCDVYCHSLTDASILGPDLRATGAQALTVFALHMPARLFRGAGHDAAKRAAVAATLASLESVLAEPIEPLVLGLEALTPVELEAELRMPGGNIFHRTLQWPFAETAAEAGRWGVETELGNVWVCGAGARRGGGVSGIAGHNAARAVLEAG
jgi:phytoene dehydrogenase-like protein